MHTRQIIHTLPLYPKLDAELINLLKSLSAEDWSRPTVCRLWNVKDIAAHMLDGCYLRRLSIARDQFMGAPPPQMNSHQDLVSYLNQLNADWVKTCKRISPQVLISLMEEKSKEVVTYFHTLDPEGEAIFPVAWAGEERSANWFDIARDYTERWLHQQQIRLAVDKPGIMTRELYHPLV
jgi:hypothetical protein